MIEKDLERNTINIRSIMKNTNDLTIKYAKVGQNPVCVMFCEGQININQMANLVYQPINAVGNDKKLPAEKVMEMIQGELLLAGEQKTISDCLTNRAY